MQKVSAAFYFEDVPGGPGGGPGGGGPGGGGLYIYKCC